MSFDLSRLIRADYWLDVPEVPAGPFAYAVVGVFAVLTVAGLVVWLRRRQLFPGHRVKVRLAAQVGPWFVTMAITGLAFAAMRLTGLPALTSRIFWLLCLLTLIGISAYVVWYMRERYPLEVARFERDEMRRRYVPRRRERARSSRRR